MATLWAVVFLGATARAHDPLEISTTIYMRTNQLELVAEMELRPARVLTGAGQDVPFESVLERMNARASSFFRIWSGDEMLVDSSATALPSVENHVQLRVLYPRPKQNSLKVEAPLLEELAPDGPYGVSLTILDMVNQKVVGQSVFFADNPATRFMSISPEAEAKPAQAASAPTPTPSTKTGPTQPPRNASGSSGEKPATSDVAWWLVVALCAIGAWWVYRYRNRARRRRL